MVLKYAKNMNTCAPWIVPATACRPFSTCRSTRSWLVTFWVTYTVLTRSAKSTRNCSFSALTLAASSSMSSRPVARRLLVTSCWVFHSPNNSVKATILCSAVLVCCCGAEGLMARASRSRQPYMLNMLLFSSGLRCVSKCWTNVFTWRPAPFWNWESLKVSLCCAWILSYNHFLRL